MELPWGNAMYISSIRIQNYRCFQDNTIDFTQGLNIIIGENNSGKTTVLKALQLVFNRSNTEKPAIEDFYKKISSFDVPPEIKITVTIKETPNENPYVFSLPALRLAFGDCSVLSVPMLPVSS
jgi:predicted ATP-dependent endonuclease of OLD family